MSNVLKGYYLSVEESHKVVDSNDLVELRIREEEEKRIKDLYSEENMDMEPSDGFVPGLPTETLDVLISEEAEEEHIIKTANDSELNEMNLMLENAREELASIQAEADSLIQSSQAEAEEIKQRAFEEAQREGYENGYNEGLSAVEQMKGELQDQAAELENEYQSMIASLEPQFVDIITDIYEHIFHVNLSEYKGLVSGILIDTINNTDGARNMVVHVAKDNYQEVVDMKDEILTETGMRSDNVEFIQDATLPLGGCVIETENGVYDCSVETELSELKRKLTILSYRK